MLKNPETNKISLLLKDNEEWLLAKTLANAKGCSYVEDASTLKETGQTSIRTLSSQLIGILQGEITLKTLNPKDKHSQQELSSIGSRLASYHQQQGIGPEILLSLLKHYKQSYLDIIETIRLESGVIQEYYSIVYHFFDRVELGICSELRDYIAGLQEKGKELEQLNSQLIYIIDSLPDPTFVLDRDQRVVFWNKALEKMTGVAKDQIIGKGDYTYAVPIYGKPRPLLADIPFLLDPQDISNFYNDIRRKEQGLYSEVYSPHINKGKGAFLWVKATPFFDSEGKLTGVIESIRDITKQKTTEKELSSEKEQLSVTLSSIGDGVIATDTKGQITIINLMAEKLTGYTSSEAIGLRVDKVFNAVNESSYEPEDCLVDTVIRTGKAVYSSFDVRLIAKNGIKHWISRNAAPINNKEGGLLGVVLVFRDVTKGHLMQNNLQESAAFNRAVLGSLLAHIAVIDRAGTIIAVNHSWEKFAEANGTAPEKVGMGRNYLDVCRRAIANSDQSAEAVLNGLNSILNGESDYYSIEYSCHSPVAKRWFLLNATPLRGGKSGAVLSHIEITKRKLAEEKLTHLSIHDPLTGVYNRTFFEQQMSYLETEDDISFGIIICDIDGLKLVNDTLGHEKGDQLLLDASNIIRKSFRDKDIISRIGGDEFAVLIKDTNSVALKFSRMRIKNNVDQYNTANPEIPLSISVGFSISSKKNNDVNEIFKEADNNMYSEKLHNVQSGKHAIVQTLMKALEARDFITEGHADRLKDFAVIMVKRLDFLEHKIADMKLFAQFHDIGKVGIPDRILFKEGALTEEEFNDMKRHCEIGYRIAQSSPDLMPIADWILRHHEWWNGEGYPMGDKGENIPLECRVLSILDAYDAMTSDRPYRKAMSHKKAVKNLITGAGSQFDPELVKIFLELFD
ncbi:MAG: PAS domain S-box protein [Peptococcaceae bacterium]|nr:PAS domain S-box protein [Peptococcaceae bacterium]